MGTARSGSEQPPSHTEVANPLRNWFDGIEKGPGVWKWLHYFDVYHRHLSRFVGREVTVVEVGVYSGGSLPMWRSYFGDGCRIHGIDIVESCKIYETAGTSIHIGDQADRGFWRRFREQVPVVDILIDDGGHKPEQQIVTLEEMLPHLRPGGVFVCEDVHGLDQGFAAFVQALSDQLNTYSPVEEDRAISTPATSFQADIRSVHLYPFMAAIEKRETSLVKLEAPMHGTEWQPFGYAAARAAAPEKTSTEA